VRRAPWAVAAAFGVAATLAILLTGPLLLFNPWFVAFEQQRHGVADALGASPEAVTRVTSELIADLFRDGGFVAGLQDPAVPFLDASERSHMADVGRLVRALTALNLLAIVTTVLGWSPLGAEPERRGRVLLAAAIGLGSAAVVVGLTFALAFPVAFAAFHALFFAPGSWIFGPDSHLIGLFPQPFWFEIALVAGAAVVASAALAGWLAWRDLARGTVAPA